MDYNETLTRINSHNVDQEELVGFLEDLYDKSSQNRKYLDYEWLLNQAYIAGDQYKTYDANFKLREFSRVHSYEEKEVRNKLRGIKNQFKVRITQTKPKPHGVPKTPKEKDVRIAKTTNALIHEVWENQDIEEKIDELGEFLANYGSGFIKLVWDNTLGKKILSVIGKEEELIKNNHAMSEEYRTKLLEGLLYKKSYYTGDVNISILPPFECYVENVSTRNMKHVKRFIHAKAYDRETLKIVYKLTDEDIPVEEVSAITLQNTSKTSGLGYVNQNYGYQNYKLDNYSTVLEYYEQPTTKFPGGRFIVKVGKKIVHYGELPYNIGRDGKKEIPFIRVVANEELGNFYGNTPLSDLRGVQRNYNATRNRTIEGINRKSLNQMVAYVDSFAKPEAIKNSPGSIFWLKPGKAKPTFLPSGIQLMEFYREAEQSDKEFSDISGLMQPGQIPASVRSGSQTSMLFQSENLNLSTPINNIAKSVKKLFRWVIRMYQQYSDGERFLNHQDSHDINGPETWNKEIINDNIYIKNVNALVLSPAQQEQKLTDTLNLGLWNEQNQYGAKNTIKLFETMGLGHLDNMNIPYMADYEKAKRENRRVSFGSNIVVDEFDNHVIHYQEHKDFIISEDWEQLALRLQEEGRFEEFVKYEEVFRKHIKEHELELQKMAMNRARNMKE